jgi:hypothetical protein
LKAAATGNYDHTLGIDDRPRLFDVDLIVRKQPVIGDDGGFMCCEEGTVSTFLGYSKSRKD